MFGKRSRGRTQGLSKIFRVPIYRAHRTVIYAVGLAHIFLVKILTVAIFNEIWRRRLEPETKTPFCWGQNPIRVSRDPGYTLL